MRQFIGASLLMLALSISAYADGNMGQPTVQPPPATLTSPTQTGTEPTTDGNMGDGATERATAIALNLLQTLLTLF